MYFKFSHPILAVDVARNTIIYLLRKSFLGVAFRSWVGCDAWIRNQCHNHHPIGTGQLTSLLLRTFLPDPLQRLAELSTALWSHQVTPPKDAANPPDLKTAKDQGDQTQLDVSPVQVLHYACCCALWQRLVCWCCLNAHWLPFTTIPQCSQGVVGAERTQLAGRSPTSSLRDGSIPRLCW